MDYWNITEYLFLILICIFTLQSLLWINLFVRINPFISSYKKRKAYVKNEFQPATLIVCARNEAANLKKNLPFLLRQSNIGFQVIVIDDGSTDNTLAVLEQFAEKHPSLKVLHREKNEGEIGKREALKMAIEAAQTNILVFTDADCHPKSHQWINTMQYDLDGVIEIVLGYGPIEKEAGLTNKLARYESFTSAFMYMNMALWGFTYMGVGRNLLFKKSLFNSIGGFGKYTTAGGDDDLLLQKMAGRENVSIAVDDQSFVYTSGPDSLLQHIKNRGRHIKSSIRYKWIHQLWLGFFHFASLMVYGLTFYLLFQGEFLVIPIIVSRWVLWILLVRKTSVQFKENDLLRWVPILDFYQLIVNIMVLFYSPFKNKRSW